MKINSPRQKALQKALRKLVPMIPMLDSEAILTHAKSTHMQTLSPVDAIWLATISHIRHRCTDYDQLRDNGYDEASARHFVLDETNQILAEWAAKRLLENMTD
jgi:hypothetical protein